MAIWPAAALEVSRLPPQSDADIRALTQFWSGTTTIQKRGQVVGRRGDSPQPVGLWPEAVGLWTGTRQPRSHGILKTNK